MANHTEFKSTNPFYGGISPRWGAGLHEDADTTTTPPRVEVIKADYINRIELRVERIESIFNQLEHEVIYPSGRINTGVNEDVPASGEYYLASRIDLLCSTLNSVISGLIAATIIDEDDVPYYPLHVGTL